MDLFGWVKPNVVLEETRRNQHAAADPRSSAWVSANAGTGKTHVLTMRVLRLLLAESEIGWLPFLLQQWDYYFERFRRDRDLPIKRKPSEIFNEHVYGTFLEDYVGTRFFPWWGEKNCMWSNDYPHFNMTFPHSRQVVEYHLNGLSEEKRQRLTRDNAIELFGLKGF